MSALGVNRTRQDGGMTGMTLSGLASSFMIFWAGLRIICPVTGCPAARRAHSVRRKGVPQAVAASTTCHKVYVVLDLRISNDSKHVVLNRSNIVDAQESCLPDERYVRKVAKQIVGIAHIVESMPTALIFKLRVPNW